MREDIIPSHAGCGIGNPPDPHNQTTFGNSFGAGHLRSCDDEEVGASVDRELLERLDAALAAVADAVPWAERSANRVVWATGHDHAGNDVDDDLGDVARFDRLCSEIRAADVGNGWFVHPADRRRARSDVPTEIDELGPCTPFGSTGGGDWFVLSADGSVWVLPPSTIRDGRYEPGPVAIAQLAPSVRGFVEAILAAATSDR